MPATGDTLILSFTAVSAIGGSPSSTLVIGDFTVTLTRDGSAAAESVSLVHGSGDDYQFRIVTAASGHYTLKAIAIWAGSQGEIHTGDWDVDPVGALVPAEADSFCALSDVETMIGRTFDSTSKPSDTAVLVLMRQIASAIVACCQIAGKRITPANGDTPLGSTGPDLQLADMLREANAAGVCALVEASAFDGTQPTGAERAGDFQNRYVTLCGGVVYGSAQSIEGTIPAYIRQTLGSGSWAANHHSLGFTTPMTRSGPTREERVFDGSTRW